jgi:DNA-3-methyladenine glycosylase I
MPQIKNLQHTGLTNCAWQTQSTHMQHYHDHEWGVLCCDDNQVFEKLCLESLQAGLSWRIVLDKRPALRQAFQQFIIEEVASFSNHTIETLLHTPGIIQHKKKIHAICHNATIAKKLQSKYASLHNFLWQFYDPATPSPSYSIPQQALHLHQALKAAGWQFMGPTTTYAFMQASGMLNDHDPSCPARALVEEKNQNLLTCHPHHDPTAHWR